MYVLYACTYKEPKKSSEHTSEHVKSAGPGMPPDPPSTIYIMDPHVLYLPWASPILLVALTAYSSPRLHHSLTMHITDR